MWTAIALASLGAVAAAGAASQRDHYRSTFVTPRGTYRSFWSAPSTAGQLQATAIVAGTGVGLASIQNQLDNTRAALGEEIVQLTTVDPGESYGGRFVIAKVKPKPLPSKVQLTINWNGEAYSFAFQIAKNGTPAPVFTAITRQSDLTNFAAPPTAAQPVVAIDASGSTTDATQFPAPAGKVEASPVTSEPAKSAPVTGTAR